MDKKDFIKRADAFKPKVFSSNQNFDRRQAIEADLPKGYSLGAQLPPRLGTFSPSTIDSTGRGGGGGQTMNHMQRPYFPSIESPDRLQYPTNRLEANYYWRMFHKLDPMFGSAVDMYSEMLVSDFDIIVEENDDKEIKKTVEYMCEKVNFVERFKQMVREYLVIGEVFPHCIFSEELGIWDYIAIHNPDYINVVDSPIIATDPILSFVPDDNLVNLLSDRSPESIELRNSMPNEYVSRILAKQPIRLQSSNCSFIARKLSPYDIRGTSLASRLWRIWMVEDAVYASTIATYRRAAAPIKAIKLGDPQTGWIPDESKEQELLYMLNRCEIDSQCFVPETLITKADGTQVPIDELEVGDDLLDKNGDFCKVEVLQNEYTNELVELDIVGTPDTRCTTTHKWPIWGGPRTCSCGCGAPIRRGNFAVDHGCNPNGYKYKEKSVEEPRKYQGIKVRFLEGFDPYQKLTADQIRPGDYLMIPRKFKEQKPKDVTLDMARLLGYYVAEGNTIKIYEREDGSVRTGVEFSFSSDEGDDNPVKDVCNIIEDLIGHKPELSEGKHNNRQIKSRRNATTDLAVWLEKHGGKYARKKKLSAEVMNWPLELKYEFIKGYLAGDGCSILAKPKSNSKARYIEATSSSINLLNQVKLVFAQLGTYASFDDREQSEGAFSPGNDIYRLHVRGKWASKLSKDVWGFDAPDYDREKSLHWWIDDDYLYIKVRGVKISELDEPQRVVNMTVSGDHSYMTNCIGTYNSWLIYHYGIQFEQWGNTERAISIKGEHDVIEKVKLIALGLSKGFMSGEVSYASVKGGLQVFLRRLLSLRQFFEAIWTYPKFINPIAKANDWVKSSPKNVDHQYRVKKTSKQIDEENLLIKPKIRWKNKLDPAVDSDQLQALLQMEKFGFKVSKGTVSIVVGLDWKTETRKAAEEWKEEKEIVKGVLGDQAAAQYAAEQPKAKGGPPGSSPGAGGVPPGAKKPPGGEKKPAGATPPGGGEAGAPEEEIETPDAEMSTRIE